MNATQPLRVLALAASASPETGWGTYAKSVTALLRTNGMEITLLTAEAGSPQRLPNPLANRISWWAATWRLRQWLRAHRGQFDVIHVMAEPYARLSPAFHGIPFIITIHGSFGDPVMHGSGKDAFARALTQAAHLITVSDFTRTRLPAAVHARATAIPNGVDPAMANEPFDPAPAHGTPRILSVGKFTPRKGFEQLIAGFAVYAQQHPTAELVLIGPDPAHYRPTLERAVADAGLTGRVHILGEVSRRALLGWYRACNVFALLPNDRGGFEGFGLVYLEAAIFGKPSVGSLHSGAGEAIQDGVSGILCNPQNAAEVAQALTRAHALNSATIRAFAQANQWSTRARAYRAVFSAAASSSVSRKRG